MIRENTYICYPTQHSTALALTHILFYHVYFALYPLLQYADLDGLYGNIYYMLFCGLFIG